MKKITILAVAVSLFAMSCKKEQKEETTTIEKEVVATTPELTVVSDSTKVSWTAYKTTDKTPVNGNFTKITLTETNIGTTPEEVLEGAKFSIPVSSLFTNDETRDSKLLEFFFGVLKDTELINGTINFVEGKTFLNLNVNGVSKSVEVKGAFNDKLLSFEGEINLDDFNAQGAIVSLNKVCGDLHKGADGVSKTWSEVAIKGSVLFQ